MAGLHIVQKYQGCEHILEWEALRWWPMDAILFIESLSSTQMAAGKNIELFIYSSNYYNCPTI